MGSEMNHSSYIQSIIFIDFCLSFETNEYLVCGMKSLFVVCFAWWEQEASPPLAHKNMALSWKRIAIIGWLRPNWKSRFGFKSHAFAAVKILAACCDKPRTSHSRNGKNTEKHRKLDKLKRDNFDQQHRNVIMSKPNTQSVNQSGSEAKKC